MSPPDLESAVLVVDEPQHGIENLHAFREHGEEWVSCGRCGRQWAVHGADAEIVSDGDGYCDEHKDEDET